MKKKSHMEKIVLYGIVDGVGLVIILIMVIQYHLQDKNQFLVPETNTSLKVVTPQVSTRDYYMVRSSNPQGNIFANEGFEESVFSCFAPFTISKAMYPPVDSLFMELLKEGVCNEKKVEQYSVIRDIDPKTCFALFEKEGGPVYMTAKEILTHFSKYKNQYSEKNWFVLTTQPQKSASEVTHDDLRLVNIWETSKGVYVLYCLAFKRWSTLSASWIHNESSIYIPK